MQHFKIVIKWDILNLKPQSLFLSLDKNFKIIYIPKIINFINWKNKMNKLLKSIFLIIIFFGFFS